MTDLHDGLVISHLGKGIAVEVDGHIILCQTRRKIATVAAGDKVKIRIVAQDQGCIEELLPRHSLLERPSKGAKTRPVAANIDQIFVVFATEPFCDFLLIDQYLAICENRNINALLIYNKSDLATACNIEQELETYQSLGYTLFRVSAKKNSGIDELKQALSHKISIFTGQSGVGKSSLTNALIPDKELKTNTVSAITKHGRHTTTAATLYHLPAGGDLIDSPGVAIFGLAGLSENQLAHGYREFQPYIDKCQFNDCRHLKDKGCAIQKAVKDGFISQSRYQRFVKLREKMPTD
ncbi:ribosome biogenesis GTPase RsgA [Methyloprofundus sedimenti]|uniref:Small ribosomal subunit biogenesis GTPase RsgA n=1 Tax=Methyloprofundus sedimenti TaxID=1420851 RepID=A0A1V8M2S1_9GAMM|nr:ribosome small subunit-dependent GTPase A [Methyloprofundus sedimenti]OQK15796.1 ribosome biogenesis GTPase RsgA [Methyloprofundus sedimenti]